MNNNLRHEMFYIFGNRTKRVPIFSRTAHKTSPRQFIQHTATSIQANLRATHSVTHSAFGQLSSIVFRLSHPPTSQQPISSEQ